MHLFCGTHLLFPLLLLKLATEKSFQRLPRPELLSRGDFVGKAEREGRFWQLERGLLFLSVEFPYWNLRQVLENFENLSHYWAFEMNGTGIQNHGQR